MIIVEGPDGGGKTNLVRRLEKTLQLKAEARVVSKTTQPMGDLMSWVETDLAGWPRAALYDRHRLISEPIYGPVLREAPNPGFQDLEWLTEMQQRFVLHSPLVIYCLPPFEVVRQNVMTGDDNVVVQDHISKIYWLYFMAATRNPLSLVWDYTDPDPTRLSVVLHAAYLRTERALEAEAGR